MRVARGRHERVLSERAEKCNEYRDKRAFLLSYLSRDLVTIGITEIDEFSFVAESLPAA